VIDFLEVRQEFDWHNLYQFFEAGSFYNDLLVGSCLVLAVA